MELFSTSRKDDLISLYYLIIFLIEDSLPFIPTTSDLAFKSDREIFSDLKYKKKNLTPETLCFT